MKLAIFGLTISSSWGNGHATLWRGLCRALHERGHRVVFFERNAPYYAAHRDLFELPGGELVLYGDWEAVRGRAREAIREADIAMVSSYCPDGIAASEEVFNGRALRVFYDLDTPVTLATLQSGRALSYIGARGLREFDLVLSYTGGRAIQELKRQLGAGRTAALYGSVDPRVHRPAQPVERFRSDLSYLGTYSGDRQQALKELFLEPAARSAGRGFLIGGALYPADFPWRNNIRYIEHVAPGEHPAFYGSGRLNLSVTRGTMAAMGYCPSGRLFEAAACGAPLVSDTWEGLEVFFEPGKEILTASRAAEILQMLGLSDAELQRLGQAARERALGQHTAKHRAEELERLLEAALQPAEA